MCSRCICPTIFANFKIYRKIDQLSSVVNAKMRQSNKLVILLLAFQLSIVNVKCNLSGLGEDSSWSDSSIRYYRNLVRPNISFYLKHSEGDNADAHLEAVAEIVRIIGENVEKGHLVREQTAKSDEANKKPLFAKVSDYARRFVAPANYYLAIARRYRDWYRRYNLFQQAATRNGMPVLRDAMDTLKIQYAKIDQKLIKESCALPLGSDSEGNADLVNKSQVENVDHVLRALGELIDELERKLDKLEQSGGLAIELDANSGAAKEEQVALDEMNKLEQEASVQLSIDRAKRIAKKQAKQISIRKIKAFASIALIKLAVYFVKNNFLQGEHILKRILLMFDGPSIRTPSQTPLRFINDVQFRAVLGLINYSIAAISCQINRNAII